jgi:cytoplasmic iron level regulating protein YaaA (DUF328/UPF0246 family)
MSNGTLFSNFVFPTFCVTLGKTLKRKYKNMNKFWREKMREKIKEERDRDKVT